MKRMVRMLTSVMLSGICLGEELHVSLDGNDNNPGTREKPLLTLEGARDHIRTLRTESGLPEGGVKVYLRGGTYERATSFTLTKEDSGSANAPISYASAPGEVATLTGGRVLKPEWFTKVTDTAVLGRLIDKNAHAKILQIDLKKHGITDFGEIARRGFNTPEWRGEIPPLELYMDGERLHLARWPNMGQEMVHMSGVQDPGPMAKDKEPGFNERGGTFSYGFSRPGLWKEETDIWIDGVLSQDWAWTYNKVASIDTKAKTITLQ